MCRGAAVAGGLFRIPHFMGRLAPVDRPNGGRCSDSFRTGPCANVEPVDGVPRDFGSGRKFSFAGPGNDCGAYEGAVVEAGLSAVDPEIRDSHFNPKNST